MSGFEVIGLVLALYPMILDGIKAYQTVKTGQGIKDLVAEVKGEQIVFHNHLADLLGPLVPCQDITPFLDPKSKQFSRWKNVQFLNSIESTYGQDKGSFLLFTLKEIKKELDAIQHDLKFLLRQRVSLAAFAC